MGVLTLLRTLAWVMMLLGAAAAPGFGQAGADWSRVKALDPGTQVRMRSLSGPRLACAIVQVDDAQLVCSRTRTLFLFAVTRQMVFRRERVREVRLTRPLASGLAGAGIGFGAGLGVGFGLQDGATAAEDPGVLPAVMGLLGALAGGAIGAGTDFLGGPAIYRIP